MDEELQKRNTDCVYFLASPLTCKKGIECEYRHSEIARLNPRDCWYWLAGSCLNPSCAFRHPPLDVHAEVTEALPDSTAQPHPGSVPVTKSNVPCYFFFNGFCNKGDKCSFLHGPTEDGKPGWKSSKTASAVTAPPPIDTKTSTGSDAGSTPIGTNPNPSKAAHGKTAETQNNLKEDAYLDNINKRSASPPIPVSKPEEAAAVTSGTLLPGKDLINQSPQSSTDQSSEEQMNCHTEREEWLESSPGFDVLVDDVSENLAYEGDSDYVLPVDRDGRELNGHFYDYEVPAEYDAIYADAVALYEQDRRVSRDERDVEQRVDYIRNGNERSTMGDHIMGPVYPRKRKYLPVDMVIGGRRSEDLRDHLKKRRVIDDRRHPPPFSRRNHFPSVLADRTRERSRPHQLPRGIMTSEMDNNRVGQARPSNPRQRQKERRKLRHQVVSSEVVVSRRHDSRKRRLPEESSTFSGPKTLAQIKEDKMKSAEKRNSSGRSGSGHHRSRSTEEFQGPKPLSEILKEKSQIP